jgi:hypothetical protein
VLTEDSEALSGRAVISLRTYTLALGDRPGRE